MESLRIPVKSRGRCVRRDFSVVREKRSLADAQTPLERISKRGVALLQVPVLYTSLVYTARF